MAGISSRHHAVHRAASAAALDANVVGTGSVRALTAVTMQAANPAWTSDSAEVLYSAKGALWRVGIAAGSTPQRLPFVGEDGVTPVVSRNAPGAASRLAYVRSFSDSNIWRISTAGPGTAATGMPVVAIASTRTDLIPNLSPDEKRIVFMSDRSGELEVWVADTAGASAVPITSMGMIPGFGRWSPEVEKLITNVVATSFDVIADGIYFIERAGGTENLKFYKFSTRQSNVVASNLGRLFAGLTVSRDGRSIFFARFDSSVDNLMLADNFR